MSLKAEDGGCAVSTRLLTVQHHLGAVYKNIPRSRSPSQDVTPHRSSNQGRWLTLHHLNAPAEPHKLWHTEVFRLQGTCDDNVAPAARLNPRAPSVALMLLFGQQMRRSVEATSPWRWNSLCLHERRQCDSCLRQALTSRHRRTTEQSSTPPQLFLLFLSYLSQWSFFSLLDTIISFNLIFRWPIFSCWNLF